MHWIADRISEKFKVHRSQPMVLGYGSALFSARRDVILLYVTVAAGPIPPVAENTRGVKKPCSTSIIRCW